LPVWQAFSGFGVGKTPEKSLSNGAMASQAAQKSST